MKLATFNVNSLKVRLPILTDWLARTGVDAVVLQETKCIDELFPKEDLTNAGYECFFCGQKTYNGVALLARKGSFKQTELITLNLPNYADTQARLIAVRLTELSGESFIFIGGYFPNGQEVGSIKYLYKLDWIATLTDWIRNLQKTNQIVLAGDFNIAPTDDDVWDPKAWEGNILVSPAERDAYKALLATGLVDAWTLDLHPEKSFSWWDYRFDGFRKNQGLRIDHIFLSEKIAKRYKSLTIDTNPRKAEKPSDHTPVVLEL